MLNNQKIPDFKSQNAQNRTRKLQNLIFILATFLLLLFSALTLLQQPDKQKIDEVSAEPKEPTWYVAIVFDENEFYDLSFVSYGKKGTYEYKWESLVARVEAHPSFYKFYEGKEYYKFSNLATVRSKSATGSKDDYDEVEFLYYFKNYYYDVTISWTQIEDAVGKKIKRLYLKYDEKEIDVADGSVLTYDLLVSYGGFDTLCYFYNQDDYVAPEYIE